MQQSKDKSRTPSKYTNVLIVTALCVFILAMVSVFTQDIKAQEASAPDANKNGDLQERRSETRDLKEENRKSTRLERLQLRGKNVLDRIDIRTKRLLELTSAIKNVANKAKEKGADTESVTALISEAETNFSTAQTLTSEARALLEEINEESAIPALATEFKAKAATVYQELTNGRKKIVEAVQMLKTLLKEGATEQTN